MKKSFLGFDIEISDWTPRLKIAAIIFSAMAMVSICITLFFQYSIPGLTPLLVGVVMLLLGIRELNFYFKVKKRKLTLTLGILYTLLFSFDLYIGIDQLNTFIFKQIGLK